MRPFDKVMPDAWQAALAKKAEGGADHGVEHEAGR